MRKNLSRCGLFGHGRSCADTGGSIYRACLFLNNRDPNGGAMYLSNANAVIEDCAFVNNAATGPTSGANAGGAVYVNDWTCGQHTFTFTRCVFANNSAVWGGAIYSQGVYPASTTQMPIANCIFAGNLASQGAAMWNWYITVPVSNSWFCGIPDQIRNFWINAGGNQFNGDCSGVPYADCDSDGVPDSLEIALGLASDCNGDGVPNACEIASGSASDENGNGVPDACEPCIADLNGDTLINGFDFSLLLNRWGAVPAGEPADLDEDGNVGASDIALLLNSWGNCEL